MTLGTPPPMQTDTSTGLTPLERAGLPIQYDPHEGLKTVAVAEAAEKHFRRAKDAKQLQLAVETKLQSQYQFIVWYDAQPKQPAGRPPKEIAFSSESDYLHAEDYGLSDLIIHRWRRAVGTAELLQSEITKSWPRVLKLIEKQVDPHVLNASGHFEWYTPPEIVEAARWVLESIDLDPASSSEAQAVVSAAKYYSLEDDGLKHKWAGRVFMNPPYESGLIDKFTAKLGEHFDAGDVTAAVVYINNATETQWFKDVVSRASAVCFPTGRISCWTEDGRAKVPLQGQCILYLGEQTQAFFDAFTKFGWLAEVRR